MLAWAENRLRSLPGEPIPVLVELHDFGGSSLTFENQIAEQLKRHNFPRATSFITRALNRGGLLLLLDGLDEVDTSARATVVASVKAAMDSYWQCRFIVTCRTAVYKDEFADKADKRLHVVEFNDQQIRQFLLPWRKDMVADRSVEQLISALHDRPKILALARNPLLLTIIAHLYTDVHTESRYLLPHSRADFYEQATELLLEKWHEDRASNRFRGAQKDLVLRHLALYNQDSSSNEQQEKFTIDYGTVIKEVSKVLNELNLPEEDAQPIVDEIVDRSGLLLEIDGGKEYQFAHLTLQEFFAAEALNKKEQDLIERFRQDPERWRETVKLWCGIGDDQDSSNVIRAVYQVLPITAFEALPDAKVISDQSLVDKIVEDFKARLGERQDGDAIHRVFGVVASDLGARGMAVFAFLEESLEKDPESPRGQAAAIALSFSNVGRSASLLAKHYGPSSVVRLAMVRMGDVAVESLEALAAEGSTSALDDLREIGTPYAGEALVRLLWHASQSIAESAAWRVAELLREPGIEEALKDYPLTVDQRQTEPLEWLWAPFGGRDTSLGVIVGRLGSLIKRTSVSTAPVDVNDLDPRVVIPLVAIDDRPRRLEELRARRWGRKRTTPMQDVLDHIDVRPQEWEDSDPRRAQAELQNMIARFADAVDAEKKWSLLLSSLSPATVTEILNIFRRGILPSRSDWERIHDLGLELDRSWLHMAVGTIWVTGLVLALYGAVVVIFGGQYTASGSAILVNALILLGLGSLGYTVYYTIGDQGPIYKSMRTILALFVSPLYAVSAISSDESMLVKIRKFIVISAATPSLAILDFVALMEFVKPVTALLIVSITLGTCIAVTLTMVWYQARHTNPLRYILGNDTSWPSRAVG
jgi:hypothetical protein